MTDYELEILLENHLHWVKGDCEGWETMRADLRGANLCRADLYGADLRGADLRGAKNVPDIYLACPSEGPFVAWKKAFLTEDKEQEVIVKLLIPEDARRLSATTRKCRCDKAKVLEVQDMDGNVIPTAYAVSNYNSLFHYRVGEEVAVEDFDNNRWNECSTGIHFFIDRKEAEEWRF